MIIISLKKAKKMLDKGKKVFVFYRDSPRSKWKSRILKEIDDKGTSYVGFEFKTGAGINYRYFCEHGGVLLLVKKEKE